MGVITLSRHIWAGAEEIVEMVCRELGFIFVDREKIGEVVSEFGFQFTSLEKYDEKKPPLWDFLSRERYNLVRAIQIAICELARKGNVIIIGRGANILLKDIPGVLRVRIIAPFEIRVKNMARTGKAPEEIYSILRHRDRDSEGFVRHHYHADLNDPLLYDIVINTENMSYASAARFIIDSHRAMDEAVDFADAQKKLADLSLKQKIELALMQKVKEEITNLDVEVHQGNVVLSGFVSNEEFKKACTSAASGIEGVKSLDNRISIFYAMGT
jgi:cytidylate kinase